MHKVTFSVSGGGLLFAALLMYFFPPYVIFSYGIAIAVHEAGHVLALYLFDYPVREITAELGGFVIRHEPFMRERDEFVCALSGPAAGLLYSAVLSLHSVRHLSAALSLVLSIFNLLPVRPLDGGTMLLCAVRRVGIRHTAAENILDGFSLVFDLFIFVFGMGLIRAGVGGESLLLAGLSLLKAVFFREGIVKKTKMR